MVEGRENIAAASAAYLNKAVEPTAPMVALWHAGVIHGAAAHRGRSASLDQNGNRPYNTSLICVTFTVVGVVTFMTKLLEEAFAEAAKLSAQEQDALAAVILDELASERRWDQAFADSADLLAQLADQALAEHRAGKTQV